MVGGRLDALSAAWPHIVERLQGQQWPVEICRLDLQVMLDRSTHPTHPQPIPGRALLRKRWGVTDWRVRQLLRELGRHQSQPTTHRPLTDHSPTSEVQANLDNQPETNHSPTTRRPLASTRALDPRYPATPLPRSDTEQTPPKTNGEHMPSDKGPALPIETRTTEEMVIRHWYDAWYDFAPKHPTAKGCPRKLPAGNANVRACLKKAIELADAEDEPTTPLQLLQRLIDWTFTADDWHARMLRGEVGTHKGTGRNYLGLAGIFRHRGGQLGERNELARVWHQTGRRTQPITGGHYTPPADFVSPTVTEADYEDFARLAAESAVHP